SLVLAWYFVALTNSEITEDSLAQFLGGYQSVVTLDIAELWALPVFLCYMLVENLRRLSDRVASARVRRALANAIADELATVRDPRAAAAVIAHSDALVTDDTVAAQLYY